MWPHNQSCRLCASVISCQKAGREQLSLTSSVNVDEQESVSAQTYPTESVFEAVQQKSIPAQIRPRIFYTSNRKGYVDGFVVELTFANGFRNTFCAIKTERLPHGSREESLDESPLAVHATHHLTPSPVHKGSS